MARLALIVMISAIALAATLDPDGLEQTAPEAAAEFGRRHDQGKEPGSWKELLRQIVENTGAEDLVIWAFGDRVPHEIAVYPDQGVAFVEGLGAEFTLDQATRSDWTEDRRPR